MTPLDTLGGLKNLTPLTGIGVPHQRIPQIVISLLGGFRIYPRNLRSSKRKNTRNQFGSIPKNCKCPTKTLKPPKRGFFLIG